MPPANNTQTWEAAFKHPRKNDLWWIKAGGQTLAIALEKMRDQVKGTGYLLYGGPFKEGYYKNEAFT